MTVPSLTGSPNEDTPYWKRHARTVAQAIQSLPQGEPVVLVGHSGAGMLLPAIQEASHIPVAGYIFVDAGIPQDGKSRLDLFSDPVAVDQFRKSARDGLLPTWTDADLADVIPDKHVRARFVAELRPLPLAVYEESIPVFDGWPDVPCAFIGFIEESPYVYEDTRRYAEQQNWPYVKIKGKHFHMLVNPVEVVDALMDVTLLMGIA